MTVGKLCSRDVASAVRDTTVLDAAKQMRHRHVGDIVVVEGTIPVGIVTDRDIVLGVVATGLDPKAFTLGDLILKDVVTCREDVELWNACIRCVRMRSAGCLWWTRAVPWWASSP
jgi:CBS domain-containing protein